MQITAAHTTPLKRNKRTTRTRRITATMSLEEAVAIWNQTNKNVDKYFIESRSTPAPGRAGVYCLDCVIDGRDHDPSRIIRVKTDAKCQDCGKLIPAYRKTITKLGHFFIHPTEGISVDLKYYRTRYMGIRDLPTEEEMEFNVERFAEKVRGALGEKKDNRKRRASVEGETIVTKVAEAMIAIHKLEDEATRTRPLPKAMQDVQERLDKLEDLLLAQRTFRKDRHATTLVWENATGWPGKPGEIRKFLKKQAQEAGLTSDPMKKIIDVGLIAQKARLETEKRPALAARNILAVTVRPKSTEELTTFLEESTGGSGAIYEIWTPPLEE